MGTTSCGVALAVLLGSGLAAQAEQDFTGHWILVSPAPPPDTPRALSVRQSLVSTTVRGEPMIFRDITIGREAHGSTRSETYPIGIDGGVVPGVTADGRSVGPKGHHAVRWDASALVFESGTYTGEQPGTGVWTERRETWSLDSDGRLHVVIATSGSAEPTSTVVLVYRRTTVARSGNSFVSVLRFQVTDAREAFTSALGRDLVLKVTRDVDAQGRHFGWELSVVDRRLPRSPNFFYECLCGHGPRPFYLDAWQFQTGYYGNVRVLPVWGYPYEIQVTCDGCTVAGENTDAHFNNGTVDIGWRRLASSNRRQLRLSDVSRPGWRRHP
jgi:hypothetical protein